MPDEQLASVYPPPTVFVRLAPLPDGTVPMRDEQGWPAQLIEPSVVLAPVPRAAGDLLDPGAELQVVVVCEGAPVPVERIRVAKALGLPHDKDGGGMLLRLLLERPSVHEPLPIGTPAEEALLVQAALVLNEGDVWGTLVLLERVWDDLSDGIPPAALATLRDVESAPRPPEWPTDIEDVTTWFGDVIAHLMSKR